MSRDAPASPVPERAARWLAPLRAGSPRRRLALAATLSALAWGLFELSRASRATVVIVSTSGAPITVSIDGGAPREVANVAAETPGAGARVGVFAGTHRLVATPSDGRDPEVVEVRVAGGQTYLWAPLARDQCFFIEHTTYGRRAPERPALEELPDTSRFWSVPPRLDAWFVPTPRSSDADRRSTGGERTVVRQARCGTTPFR